MYFFQTFFLYFIFQNLTFLFDSLYAYFLKSIAKFKTSLQQMNN